MKRFLSLAVVLIFIAGLAGCGNERLADDFSDLYQYKTEYVGDNSKVAGIVNVQTYYKHIKPKEIEIFSEKEPYGLKVWIETEQAVTEEDLFKNAVERFH